MQSIGKYFEEKKDAVYRIYDVLYVSSMLQK